MNLIDAARTTERLVEAATVPLAAALCWTNATPRVVARQLPAFSARTATCDAIDLVSLPSALLRGDNYNLTVGDAEIAEQTIPAARGEKVPNYPIKYAEVDADAVLIARYGAGTWGHWIGELLPKVVMVEGRYPGRFSYLVPQRFLNQQDVFAHRALELLAAFGVTVDRLIGLRHDYFYRCTSLSAVTPVWTDFVMHPTAAAEMRALPSGSGFGERVALLRNDDRRGIANFTETTDVLEALGFVIGDIATLSFLDQVALFRHADTVFSTLGSTLSGLLWSPQGVNVIAAAPMEFTDRFFYGIIQMRGGTYAEVRGDVVGEPAAPYRDSVFQVPINDLRIAVEVSAERLEIAA